jgi:hypothetical protein
MAKNLVTKIVEDHMVEGFLEPGEEVGLKIDQALLQDATGTMACLQFERMAAFSGTCERKRTSNPKPRSGSPAKRSGNPRGVRHDPAGGVSPSFAALRRRVVAG